MGKYLFATPGGKSILTFCAVVLLLAGLLFYPSAMGLADNSDFKRTLDTFGMRPADPVRYLSFVGDYIIEEPKPVLEYGLDLFRPVGSNPQDYYSTQYIFVKGALFLNSLYNKLTHNDPHQFRIVFQTALYIFFYGLALTLFFRVTWLQSPAADFIFKLIVLFIFLDTGYLIYLNSFFGEATTLIFLFLASVMLLLLERGKVHPVFYIGLIVSLFIFSGSKTANFPSVVLLSAALIYYVLKNEDLTKKMIIGTAVLVMLWGAAGYVKKTPQWMEKVTTYHAVFFGISKDHPEPEKALQELGLPDELLQLESTHGYLRHPYDIYGGDFAALSYDRVGKGDVLKYYFTHPGYFLKPLRLIFVLGLIIFILSIIMSVYFFLLHYQGKTVPGWTTIVMTAWAIGGLQLLSIGVVGEYVGKLYLEAKQRPRYFIESYLKRTD